MNLRSESFADGARIPGVYAFCVSATEGHVALGGNASPHLTWSGAPAGAESFAILCHDPDAPRVDDDVNCEDRSVPHDLPREDFYHWILLDVAAAVSALAAGADSVAVTPKGKKPGPTPNGVRGVNNYTDLFGDDHDMGGVYGGYDGPCPPWNDERLHRYVFTVYALDVSSLGLSGRFGGPEALAAMAGHVLASASITGHYTLNPALI